MFDQNYFAEKCPILKTRSHCVMYYNYNYINCYYQVDSACSPTYNQLRRRRSVSNPIKHSLIKRQSPSAVESTLDDALSCSSDIVDVLNELPDTVCENEDDVLERDYTCWNGTTVNRYRRIS